MRSAFGDPPSFEGHRLVKAGIDKLVAAQDAYGAPSTDWTPHAVNVPAAIADMSGEERYADKQIEGITRFEVLISYLKGVTEKMRLTFTNDGTTFRLDIENVTNWRMQNRWMVLKCKAGVNRG